MRTIKNLIYMTLVLITFSCGNKNKNFDATGAFETTEIMISAEVSGKIMEFNLNEGQIIDSNIKIGYIDSTQLYLKKMQLLTSQKAVGNRKIDVKKQIAALEQQITSQKNEKIRFENLLKSNAANQKQLDDINTQIAVLEKQLSAQKDNLEKSNQGITDESSILEIQIAQLEDQIQKSIIKSPIKGTVLAKYSQKGEFVQPGKILFKIGDMENMFLRAYITSSQLTKIKLGQKVKVYADFGEKESKEYNGEISWISDKSEFTPKTIQTKDERANLVYAVKIAVKNDGFLKKGMYGELILN